MALLLYEGDRLVPADEVLATRDAPVDAESSALSMEVDGVEYLAGAWNLGPVELLTRQIEDCLGRLREGRPGIVRSAVVGRSGVPFHLFEPPAEPGQPARISRFFLDDDPDRELWFPLAGWGHGDPEELFAWVESHRSELLTPASAIARRKPPMVLVPAPFDELLAELEGVAEVGRAVVARARAGLADPAGPALHPGPGSAENGQ